MGLTWFSQSSLFIYLIFIYFLSTVLRARILTGPEQEVTSEDDNAPPLSSDDPDDVYSVKIVKIFKGKENATQLLGIKSIGVRSPNLVIDFHTPARWWKMCIPSLIDLEHGHEYLLSGFIDEGKLHSSYCDMRYSWTSVTHRQRKGLNGQFHNNC